MNESGESDEVRLEVGYEDYEYAEPSLGSGRVHKNVKGRELGIGPAHAVVPGDQHALCGKFIKLITHAPWPPQGMDTPCGDCEESAGRILVG